MRFDFQIAHTNDGSGDLKVLLISLLKEAMTEAYIEEDEIIERTDEEIEEWIEITYCHAMDDKFITGFKLLLDENENLKKVINYFSKKLQEADNIHLVIKYSDEKMRKIFEQYSREIYENEMKLREVMSFIFLDAYKKEYYDLLKEINVRIQKLNNNYPDEEYYNAHLENEFFFLLFSDYRKLDEVKQIKQSDLMEAILGSDDYNGLKQKILNRGIVSENYRQFIAGIKGYLESIENLRNCIAHNRSISETIRENYEHAKNGLEKSIQAFWERIKQEEQ